MPFITYNDISTAQFVKSFSLNESLGRSRITSKRVFLSYSHKDKNIIVPLVRKLNSLGANIYVDYLDESLSEKSNEEAAAILRARIKESQKFISLYTPNSNTSTWVSWELGLGDGMIKYQNVALLPISSQPNIGVDTEFKNIYGRVETKSSIYNLFELEIVYPNGLRKNFIDWINQ